MRSAASLASRLAVVLACVACSGPPPNVQTPRSPADPAGTITDGRTTIPVASPPADRCEAGRLQSPVDLVSPERGDLPRLDIAWRVGPGMVIDGKDALTVELDAAGELTLGETPYPLRRFHVHHPAEHTIDGVALALEVHLVHETSDGRLAVVGVFVVPGEANPTLAAMLDALPEGEMEGRPIEQIDPTRLLPSSGERIFYRGSLTIPPCTEAVTWNVMTTPIEASPEQIAAIEARHPINARPVQPLGERTLLIE